MPKTESIRVDANNSSVLSTSGHETASLVSVLNNTVVTSSLTVAEYFGKRHKDVLRAISTLECSPGFQGRNFALSSYSYGLPNNGRKTSPMYYLTRDGFTFLAMGFTGKVAAQFKEAYIKAFDDMEEMLRKQQCTKYAERLLKARVRELNKGLAGGVAALRKRHGANYGPAGDLQPCISYCDSMGFEDNLRNIFAQVQNAYLDGYFFAGESITAGRKLEEARKAAWELLNKI